MCTNFCLEGKCRSGMSLLDSLQVVPAYDGESDAREPSIDWESYACKFIEWTDKNPTVWHAVESLRQEFEDYGFVTLSEREDWSKKLHPGGRFVVVRNGTAILAFVIGKEWTSEQGAAITGTHTDSLAAALKPTSLRTSVDGYELLGVAPYSGGLNSHWWDRDLGIGGRLIVRDGKAITSKLVKVPYPIARIPSLAPHFGAPANGPFNLETQAVPIIGLTPTDGENVATDDEKRSPVVGRHNLRLLRLLAQHAGVSVRDILDVDLQLFDTQPASFGGMDKEFLFAPRVDNKACSFVAANALLESADLVAKGNTLTIFAGYDNEELGSLSRQGARGNLLESVIDRILDNSSESEKHVFYANSFFCSADVSHAVNPNFTNIYLDHHKPKFNVGITLSYDSNGAMITNGVSSAFIRELARQSGDKIQQFHIRNDSRSGGTIGPWLASKTGLRGVDLGIAQLSMHSIRATIGSKDIYLGVRFFKSFNEMWKDVDNLFSAGDSFESCSL